MSRVVNHHLVDQDQLDELRAPLDNWLIVEEADGDSLHGIDGPFDHWTRTVEVAETPIQDEARGHQFSATETIDFRIAMPVWRAPAALIVKWQLRRPHRQDAPWWAPPERFDRKGARTFALLIFAALAAAYLGTLLSQTITFVADEFDKGTATQGWITSMTRGGALLALVVVRQADRIGRRRMLLVAGALSAVFAAIAALSPNIWFFGAAETFSRGFATGFGILIGVFAAEEAPAGARAWITSVLALFAGLGSGMVLWLIPVAGINIRAWRILFVVALLVLPVLWALSRQLEESRRFTTMQANASTPAPITPLMKRRFAMLAAVAFCLSMFSSPASNFQNEYLRDERGFSPTRIGLFATATGTPIGIGVAIAGPQADRRGRRLVGIIGILGGIGFGAIRYGLGGPLMWVAGGLSTVVGAATIPALGVYGPELFPTSRRGMANGLLTCVGVLGSVGGLLFVGTMTDDNGADWSFGSAFGVLALAAIVAVIIVSRYPETAQKALEELNPEDEPPSVARGSDPAATL